MVDRLDELRAQLVRINSALSLAVLVLACSDGQAASTSGASQRGSPAVQIGVVDSIIPSEVALERFIAGLPVTTSLEGGASTPDALVRKFIDALNRDDTAAITGMLVSRAEYGFLYYPTSVYSRKPYQLPPDIAWILSSESNAKGVRRLLARLGGTQLSMKQFSCGRIEREGLNTVHSDCRIVYAGTSAKFEERRLFKSIIERQGSAKFLSYSGDF